MIELKCPSCGNGKLRKQGIHTYSDGQRVQLYRCKCCQRRFPHEYRKLPAQRAGISCPHCSSPETVKKGSPRKCVQGTAQGCFCKNCQKNFTLDSKYKPAQPAEVNCPYCESHRTVKVGSSLQREYGIVQPCKCFDCGAHFQQGSRKKLLIFLKGQEIHRCWDPPGLRHVSDITCPNCNQRKAVLKTEYYDSQKLQKVRFVVCLGCGQEFRGEGRPWKTGICRRLDKDVTSIPWRFEDEQWDLREFYPSIEEHKFHSLFLNFNNCGSDWFIKLVKAHILWRIQVGVKFSSLHMYICTLGFFGRFLQQQEITSMEAVDRQLLAIYWNQARSQISRSGLSQSMGTLKCFFDWGNMEGYFISSPNLITSFDRPKVFYDEPDPLEDCVVEGIRDNLHRLPEPLQLMFILGFWLGTRPSELCHISKNCYSLDPDGSTWWLTFERAKIEDVHKLPITTDLVRLIQQQRDYINSILGEDYPYLFCHYRGIDKTNYPDYSRLKPIKRPPMLGGENNPMVKAIRHLIERCDIRSTNGKLAHFTGSILRPTRATHLIRNGYSLEFIRIWLKHRQSSTTKRHYIRYRPGELLDVATVMANLDGKFYPYDSNPEVLHKNLEDLRAYPDKHELDGLSMLNGEPLIGYCTFREFCPRFGRCYTCGYHVASADKLLLYKTQLSKLQAKKMVAFEYGSSEILSSYQDLVNALENIIEALESVHE